jgi:sugar O-acyltransferase (sialic acid O-acetyltransferase NeuD family)
MLWADQAMSNRSIQIVVIGSGGFAEEIIDYLHALPPVAIVGVVDDHLRGEAPSTVRGVPFLGSFDAALAAHPQARFVVAAGRPAFREDSCEQVLAAGRELFTVVHPSAIVAPDAEIGPGCVIAPYAIVNAGARLNTGSVLNVFCSVGHGACVGAYTVLSPYAAINGWAQTGRACFLGTRATIYPRVRIGDRCEIDTHSYAKADVEDRMIVSVRSEYRVLKNRLEKR